MKPDSWPAANCDCSYCGDKGVYFELVKCGKLVAQLNVDVRGVHSGSHCAGALLLMGGVLSVMSPLEMNEDRTKKDGFSLYDLSPHFCF